MLSPRILASQLAARMRFPYVAALLGLLFLADLVIPDVIPFVDEIVLGLATALFALWQDKRKVPPEVPVEEPLKSAKPPAP